MCHTAALGQKAVKEAVRNGECVEDGRRHGCVCVGAVRPLLPARGRVILVKFQSKLSKSAAQMTPVFLFLIVSIVSSE